MRTLLALALVSAFAIAAPARAVPSQCLDAFASRYIGETERHLGRRLAIARQSDVILQFDEADALFERRGETRDAHDRYANIEISYLLERIESYVSVQLLTSNDRRTLIAGFDRRSRQAGIILIETENGARAIEFTHASRAGALAYARETLRACPAR